MSYLRRELFARLFELAPGLVETDERLQLPRASGSYKWQFVSTDDPAADDDPEAFAPDGLIARWPDRAARPDLVVVLEVVGGDDARQAERWPGYVQDASLRFGCPAELFVVAPEEKLSVWAARAFDTQLVSGWPDAEEHSGVETPADVAPDCADWFCVVGPSACMSRSACVGVPGTSAAGSPWRSLPRDLSVPGAAGLRADTVLARTSPESGEPDLIVIVEVQRAPDEAKRARWVRYLCAATMRYECPVRLCVVCPDPAVADWAAQPLDLRMHGVRVAPLVVGPEDVPAIVDPRVAAQSPEWTMLSAMMHPDRPEVTRALMAAFADPATSTRFEEWLAQDTPEAVGEGAVAAAS
ncbi:hypothetical protein [Yinghuangia soli]|uniref:Uncharacterized protein n=1 Tax=Yinghuangia soli TaxID=2908204 RepID=A0AA41PU98_9ACTN|nr:hypothetical protein [Yinghuangia soli]MCF2525821.1 hypothetical protein [Yinghuangia soli]